MGRDFSELEARLPELLSRAATQDDVDRAIPSRGEAYLWRERSAPSPLDRDAWVASLAKRG